MTEERIIERFEELKAYKEKIDSLKDDLQFVVDHCPSLRNEVLAISNQDSPLG
jgi:hypothetical protein